MNFVQIKKEGTMNEVCKQLTSRNIRKILREHSNVKKISLLYEWNYEGSTLQCYGCTEGTPGLENKHELPVGGVKMCDTLDSSDVQLLFNDIYLVKINDTKYVDLTISDYGEFYSIIFQGFDECHSDDETTSEENDDANSLDDFIVSDNDIDNSIEDSSEEGSSEEDTTEYDSDAGDGEAEDVEAEDGGAVDSDSVDSDVENSYELDEDMNVYEII